MKKTPREVGRPYDARVLGSQTLPALGTHCLADSDWAMRQLAIRKDSVDASFVPRCRSLLEPEALAERIWQFKSASASGSILEQKRAESNMENSVKLIFVINRKRESTKVMDILSKFETARLSVKPECTAPDGTDVRLLLQLKGGSLAHFELPAGEVSNAVVHRTVDELWYFVSGRGEMWRKAGDFEETVPVEAGMSVSIPVGTIFQFRTIGYQPLVFIAVTMPPWPGANEAELVAGKWSPTIPNRKDAAD